MQNSSQIKDLASQFCYWFYQSRRGKIKADAKEINEAIEIFIEINEDLEGYQEQDFRDALVELIKRNDCIEHFKEKWLSIGQNISRLLEEFKADITLNMTEDQKHAIIVECDPTLLTFTIQHDNDALECFIKSYYDIGKQTTCNNKISDRIEIREDYIVNIIKDYLKIHSHPKKEHVINGCIAPTKKSIVHLLKIYSEKYESDRSQSIFKMLFAKDLSFAKADKPIKKLLPPSLNPYEL